MSFDEVLVFLAGVNWDLVLGLSLAPVFLSLAMYYLLKGEWPWDKTYRAISLAGIFLLLGVWSASGLSRITVSFWDLFNFGGLVYLIWLGRRAWVSWMERLPVPGQTFKMQGVGEVEISRVSDGWNPVMSETTYIGPNGADVQVYTLTVHHQGALLPDRNQSKGLTALKL